MKSNALLEKNLVELFIRYVIPSIAAMVIFGTQGMIDGIFLGNFVSANAMASINIANPFMQLIIGCTMIICTGTLSFLGLTIGANDLKKAKDIFRSSIFMLAVVSVLIMLTGIIFHCRIALFLGANSVLLADTERYILITAFFAPVIAFMLMIGFTDRLLGKPNLYLAATIVCLIANILMDYINIKLLGLGVTGAAIATGVSYFIGLIVVITPVISKRNAVSIFEGRFSFKLFVKSAFNGSSEGVNSASVALALILFNRAFINAAGENGVAAFTVINYIGSFVMLVMFGVSDGIGAIVSCNYGAGNYERVRKTFFASISINFILGLIIFAMLNILSRDFVTLFVQNDEKIIEMAVYGAKLYSISFLLNGFNIVLSGFNTFVGRAVTSFLVAAGRGIVFITLGISVLPHFFDLSGVWLTVPFAEAATFIFGIIIIITNKKLYLKEKIRTETN